jgi:phage minor structural protein
MIKLFSATDTTFSTNGDLVLHPMRAIVHKEDNGSFYLDLETDLSYVDNLKEGNIIVANTPQGEQAFRIGNITKTRSKIKAKVNHVFYDSQNYLIADSYVVDKNCNDALDHLNSATEPQSEFTTISDINTIATFRCVRQSLYQAIQTVLERWGGHLTRNNFQIGIYDSIGQDNGVTVRYAKNLKDITCSANWDAVVTKLMPVGKDGILLPESYVVSETQYDIPFTKAVSFDQSDIVEDDFKDDDGVLDEDAYHDALISDLRQQAQAYVDANSVPQVNYSLSANLEKITDIGDTVEVIDEVLGINIMTSVIAYDYDCLLERYTEVQFGNFQKTLGNLMGTINSSTESIVSEQTEVTRVTLSNELNTATGRIMSVLGSSFVRYDGNQILVMDSEDETTAHNVMRINAGGIGFSTTGVTGTFNSAWTIDGVMDMQQIDVINLTANLIKGGTLKLGSESNQSGILELYDENNLMVGLMDKNGLKMFGVDGSYVLMNNAVGFAGYDRNDNPIYWVNGEEFHMKKSVIEEEITLCTKMRFIPIEIYSGSTLVNDGIGLVSVSS